MTYIYEVRCTMQGCYKACVKDWATLRVEGTQGSPAAEPDIAE